MSNARRDDDTTAGTPRSEGENDDIHPEGLDPEAPAAGVDDAIEFFDREPPERPVSDADAPPPFG